MNAESFPLRPKTAVDLILSPGITRRTFVLDISDNRIALANPRPRLDSRNILCPAILTYLTIDQPGIRYGFDVRVLSLQDDYDIAGKKFPVAIVLKTSYTRKMDLRAFPRIKIDGLRIFLEDEELDIMNVSSGGAHLMRKGRLKRPVRAGSAVTISMIRGSNVLQTKAMVMRHWQARGIGGSEHLAVKFFQTIDF
jgi:hypothetical protein